MNLPNKLTVMRMILIPFFVFFMLAPYFEGYGNYIAVAIFIIASLTDMLDGKIARKYNLVTDQRISSGCGRQWNCNCCQLLGKI